MDKLNYNCLIVDDEPIAIRVIKNHLSEFKNLRLVGECNHAIEAIEVLSKTKVDLLFLDIQMPQITGVEFLKNLNHPPKVIFTTAYRDYAIEAFELDVIDYLLKPISLLRFSKAINRFYQRVNETASSVTDLTQNLPADHLFVKADKKLHKVSFNELVYLESYGDYVLVHTEKGKITVKERISHLEEQLPQNRFLRVHRSYIISIDKVSSLLPGLVELGTHKVPIGRSYKAEVDKRIARQ
ncbi:LytR/AlgR family response regulator transcription factor [Sunxiuqinia dokdonensis]|uniref:Chemotaxis protein CheY n=1 Tax=Sunxiuqinia dokdonensis TaxID=1409788 RepID=A0A0L8V1Z0_9BACT|nr:LytTR family DNA-binding domain-containing protein [Sunxiuqinia dokdonensis]KOH42520.1 chemotaxis protein CheY [Sunxiuqinia dokdonensis]